ncbi:hypothetical protein HXX76_004135 [Chlamydomonas incerta]|uniref:SHSP domain-containing protein n=1 Tax=Chlamydomonas incerta TaxID=51695 RepID=A0A835T788_CHLIN|nr:hypothetical protein HXX76_004135 [Chlamydomonas incerta]|eukprot:KAG2440018.1 hypothetical protein HXX76_004135 [Chlamydomonas incerta]
MSLNHALRRSAAQVLARAAAPESPTLAMGAVRNASSRAAGDLVLMPFRGCSPASRSLSPFFPPSSLGGLSRAFDELIQMDRHLADVFADSPLARGSPLLRESPFRSAISKSMSVTRPAQFRAYEDCYELQADMPGVAESDLHIELDAEERLLTISGARREGAGRPTSAAAPAAEAAAAGAQQQQPAAAAAEAAAAAAPAGEAAAAAEAGAGASDAVSEVAEATGGSTVWTFRGSWRLPEDVEADGVAAALDRGVLRVTLPRRQAPEKPQPRRIKVSSGAGAN